MVSFVSSSLLLLDGGSEAPPFAFSTSMGSTSGWTDTGVDRPAGDDELDGVASGS